LARRHGGVFVLRIEDTDVERSSEAMVEGILDGMRFLGLDWDEGPKIGGPYGPYFQSGRLERYQGMADELVSRRKAYSGYCAPDGLEARRQVAERSGSAWRYDRLCLRLSAKEIAQREARKQPRAIRFHIPDGKIEFKDLVHGTIAVEGS